MAPSSNPRTYLPQHARDALLVIWNGQRLMALTFEVSVPVRPSALSKRLVVPEQVRTR